MVLGETGVCYYCTHCNFALSLLPAEQWGHPVRTVDPPLWRGPDDPMTRKKCQWTVWKSLEAIPEREYERIGRTKPTARRGGARGLTGAQTRSRQADLNGPSRRSRPPRTLPCAALDCQSRTWRGWIDPPLSVTRGPVTTRIRDGQCDLRSIAAWWAHHATGTRAADVEMDRSLQPPETPGGREAQYIRKPPETLSVAPVM